ncbi:excinuclease ABC subunit UvrB [Patescibacteria group bacterium]|nr:MAG: excinuclease ABC subunit UvrB [Patescibacteria group bacterium]
MKFKLSSKYKPAGDQPQAIQKLVDGLKKDLPHQVLLGVTGSGKTFTVANVIAAVQKPTLVIAHNKTLAAQLTNEFREFFPKNAVEYFVSYYDYYQPEAYLPRTDTYIEKEAMINEEIDRLRHAATQALLTRRDVIIVASVSCIYGLGSPAAYEATAFHVQRGETVQREKLTAQLVAMMFERTTADLKRGTFRLLGEILEVMPANQEVIYRLEMRGGAVQEIFAVNPVTRKITNELADVWIFPAKHFITLGPERERAIRAIKIELKERLKEFEREGKLLEAERLERRTKFDLEMIENIGFCHGIENYSRHLSGRKAGEPPDTLIDYFPDDFLTVIDESHITVPQIAGMYEGDASRKRALVEYGFRLPSAADNRPLKFPEFQARMKNVLYTSATPGPYELDQAAKRGAPIVEQVIRPTGLVDPEIIVRPVTGRREIGSPAEIRSQKSQVEDLIEEIRGVVKQKERVLVTTLTKKMAEDLTEFLVEKEKIRAKYLHSDVQTLDRIALLTDFRRGGFDVLVGVNLLREGLDLPEVTLVAILDADKEGFLRSETSLIQTIGRAARNVKGRVFLYADSITGSMKRAIEVTNARREKQIAYNKKHGITPQTIKKRIKDFTEGLMRRKEEEMARRALSLEQTAESRPLVEVITEKEKQMREAANALQFELAAILRDEIKELRKRISASLISPL